MLTLCLLMLVLLAIGITARGGSRVRLMPLVSIRWLAVCSPSERSVRIRVLRFRSLPLSLRLAPWHPAGPHLGFFGSVFIGCLILCMRFLTQRRFPRVAARCLPVFGASYRLVGSVRAMASGLVFSRRCMCAGDYLPLVFSGCLSWAPLACMPRPCT